MSQSPLENFNQVFGEFMAGANSLEEKLEETCASQTDPVKKDVLKQFLEFFRSARDDAQRELPTFVATTLQKIEEQRGEFSALVTRKEKLDVEIDALVAQTRKNLDEATAQRAAEALKPRKPTPAELAHERLAAMNARHGALSGSKILPHLRSGQLLHQQLLGLIQPKMDGSENRARKIGNIWENWPTASKPREPLESEDEA